MHNHTEQIRECFRQAAECAQHSNAQTDPKVKQQFLVLARLWLILADRLDLKSPTDLSENLQAPAVKCKLEEIGPTEELGAIEPTDELGAA